MFLNVTVIITIRVVENNVLGLIYIDIYLIRWWLGAYMVHLTFLVYYS